MLLTGLVWLAGSAIVAAAQPTPDRRYAAAGAAAVGIGVILAVSWLTEDRSRRYLRAVVGATLGVSLASNWLLWHLGVAQGVGFQAAGYVERIVLPLLIVLLGPLVVGVAWRTGARPATLWARRAELIRLVRPMDWVMVAYATIILLPALAVGLANHNRGLYVAQDLGLIVFFVFMYAAGRAVTAEAARASAGEIVEVLLALAVAKLVVFGWDVSPLYSYVEAAAAAALAVLLLRRRHARLLAVAVGITLLAYDAVAVRRGTNASTAIELAGALAVLLFLAVRVRRLVPLWLVVALTVVAAVGFIGYTHDGAAIRGQYHGGDASALGTTYEAHQVRATVGHSPVSFALGHGLGGTVDETNAPPAFRATLVYGGRDPAHVQEIHLVGYAFLLKAGLLGLVWLAAFLLSLAILVFRALERAARDREPALVLYAALPLLGIIQAFAASSRMQSDPLNGLALGVLATCLSVRPVAVRQAVLTHRRQLVAAALCILAGCAAVVVAGPHFSKASSPQAVQGGTSPPDTSPLPISLWIGDSYTAGAGARTGRYGEAIATSVYLGWQTDLDAEGGTGFVARPKGRHHRHDKPVPARLAADAVSFPGVDVVVIDAGRNDVGHRPAVIHRAIVSSFRRVARDFPASAVVVIAPYLMRSKPGDFLAIRRLERQLAKKYRWAFVDPIAAGWINRHSANLVRPDGIHPNQKGYDYIVAHLTPAIEQALAAAHEVVTTTCSRAHPCRSVVPRRA